MQPVESFMGIKFSTSSNKAQLTKCQICIDLLLPNEEEKERDITNLTFKVIIVPLNRKKFIQKRTYFSDIQNIILKHNPEYFVKKITL